MPEPVRFDRLCCSAPEAPPRATPHLPSLPAAGPLGPAGSAFWERQLTLVLQSQQLCGALDQRTMGSTDGRFPYCAPGGQFPGPSQVPQLKTQPEVLCGHVQKGPSSPAAPGKTALQNKPGFNGNYSGCKRDGLQASAYAPGDIRALLAKAWDQQTWNGGALGQKAHRPGLCASQRGTQLWAATLRLFQELGRRVSQSRRRAWGARAQCAQES